MCYLGSFKGRLGPVTAIWDSREGLGGCSSAPPCCHQAEPRGVGVNPHKLGVHVLSEWAGTKQSAPQHPNQSAYSTAHSQPLTGCLLLSPRSIHNCSVAPKFSQACLYRPAHGPMASFFLSLYSDLASAYLMPNFLFSLIFLDIYSTTCLKGSSKCPISGWQIFTHTPISACKPLLSKSFSQVDLPSRSHPCHFFLILVP